MALFFPHPHPSFLSPHKSIPRIPRNTALSPNPNPNPNPFSPISTPIAIHGCSISQSPQIPPLKRSRALPKASAPASPSISSSESVDFTVDDDPGEEDLAASPWEGAVVYRRDASVAHLEYCTTLERLGLGRLSTGVSRSRASVMGMRLPARRGKDSPRGSGDDGTPVLVSLDVTRRKRRLMLEGIVRTVITLGCNRCGEPAAECIFSNFSLLLTEDPIEEPGEINMGTIFGDDKSKTFTGSGNGEGEEYEDQIDWDDRLHFPAEEKEIDISKQLRDIVHVEITINAICDASCKGLCLRCGANLNKGSCSCSKEKVHDEEYGPLKNLRKQMQ